MGSLAVDFGAKGCSYCPRRQDSGVTTGCAACHGGCSASVLQVDVWDSRLLWAFFIVELGLRKDKAF